MINQGIQSEIDTILTLETEVNKQGENELTDNPRNEEDKEDHRVGLLSTKAISDVNHPQRWSNQDWSCLLTAHIPKTAPKLQSSVVATHDP